MSGSAGYWIAIGFLAIMFLAGFAMYYTQQEDLLRDQQAILDRAPAELVQDGNLMIPPLILKRDSLQNRVIPQLHLQIQDLEREQENLRMDIRQNQSNIENQKAAIATRQAEYELAYNSRKDTETRLADALATRDDDLLQNFQTLQTERNNLLQQNAILKTDVSKERIQTQAIVDDSILIHRLLVDEKQMLYQALTEKAEALEHRSEIRQEQYDGEVIDVDLITRMAVVDLGRVHNVRRGMRFDVIRWRMNRWNYIATLELTDVEQTSSVAIILNREAELRVDPVTGYVARDPEERFSPYIAQGEDHDRVVPLVRDTREEVQDMDLLDPILKGDKILNPFFDREKVLRFAFSGDPVRYSPDVIKNTILEYGGEVHEEIRPTTDYLVLGKVPDRKGANEADLQRIRRYEEMMRQAQTYGVRILREVDLFDFFEN